MQDPQSDMENPQPDMENPQPDMEDPQPDMEVSFSCPLIVFALNDTKYVSFPLNVLRNDTTWEDSLSRLENEIKTKILDSTSFKLQWVNNGRIVPRTTMPYRAREWISYKFEQKIDQSPEALRKAKKRFFDNSLCIITNTNVSMRGWCLSYHESHPDPFGKKFVRWVDPNPEPAPPDPPQQDQGGGRMQGDDGVHQINFDDSLFDGLAGKRLEKKMTLKFFQKIEDNIGELDFLDPFVLKNFNRKEKEDSISFLNATKVIKCIGQVKFKLNGSWRKVGTWFRISPTILLTCAHVLDTYPEAKFFFKEEQLTILWFKSFDKDFDLYMAESVERSPNFLLIKETPRFLLPSENPMHELFAAICKFDDKGYAVVSPGVLRGFHSVYILYPIFTSETDSGSPVINSRGEVIGIHRAGNPIHVAKRHETTCGVRLDLWLYHRFQFGCKNEKEKENNVSSARSNF
jgi:hypothetical protein